MYQELFYIIGLISDGTSSIQNHSIRLFCSEFESLLDKKERALLSRLFLVHSDRFDDKRRIIDRITSPQ